MSGALTKFLYQKSLAGCVKKTINVYDDTLNRFVRAYPDTSPEELTQEDIENYMFSLLQRDIKKTTYASYVRDLKIFLRWMADNYTVQYDYTKIKVPKSEKKNVRVYSDDDIKQIFKACNTSIDFITARNKAIISLMLDSGIRQGEVTNLMWSQVLDTKLLVYGKGGKTRFVPLGNKSKEYLEKYKEYNPYYSNYSTYVFVSKNGEPMTPDSVKRFIYKMGKELPFEFSSHKLRHNFATNYCIDNYKLNGAVDINALKTLMGHEDVKTTYRYLHYAMEFISAENSISHLDLIDKEDRK